MLQSKKRDRYDLLQGTSNQYSKPESQNRYQSGVVRHTPIDDKRVSREKLPHCPHGVKKGNICAICEPEKFREITGED